MKLPTLVILGRPNVGKSSLFNRILGRRQAIVDDQPGITRDRIYANSEWNGKRFALLDTGGLLPHSDDPLIEAVKEQVEVAAEEASRILFVVDWQLGITDLDLSIRDYLHRLNKPVIVVVNKADDERCEQDPRDFHQLGFPQTFFVSAQRGRGIGELLDVAVDFPAAPAEESETGLRIAIVGRPNVGKSSIVNALTGKPSVVVSQQPGTTRDAIDTPLRFRGQELILIDTAGLRRRGKTREAVEFYSQLRTARAIERADVVLLVLDATVGLVSEDQRILKDAYQQGRGILILMNKWDAVEKTHKTAADWEKRLRKLLGEYGHLPLLFGSALRRQRLLKALEICTEIQQARLRHVPTSALNQALQPIIERTPPPSYKGRYVRIKYVTQLMEAPPRFAFFCNRPEGIATSYRRFLEKSLRQLFDFRGVPLKLEFRKK